jgi:hypothetical protein
VFVRVRGLLFMPLRVGGEPSVFTVKMRLSERVLVRRRALWTSLPVYTAVATGCGSANSSDGM